MISSFQVQTFGHNFVNYIKLLVPGPSVAVPSLHNLHHPGHGGRAAHRASRHRGIEYSTVQYSASQVWTEPSQTSPRQQLIKSFGYMVSKLKLKVKRYFSYFPAAAAFDPLITL